MPNKPEKFAHPFYTSWRSMKQRCMNKNHEQWKNYGGKGVTICDEWMQFAGFEKWAKASSWSPGKTLDRINPSGNYEPKNCRWATPLEQGANRRIESSRIVTARGKTMSVRQWSIETGIFFTTLYKRYHAGIRGDAFLAPPKNPATPKGAKV